MFVYQPSARHVGFFGSHHHFLELSVFFQFLWFIFCFHIWMFPQTVLAREVLDTLFLFEVLARIATAPLKRLQGTIGTPRDQRSREQYLQCFSWFKWLLQFVHEQHWSHLLASWLGQHVATLSWIWVRFQVKSGNFQINIRKLDENHLSSPSSRLYVFDPLNWADLLSICAWPFRIAAGFVSRSRNNGRWSGIQRLMVDGRHGSWHFFHLFSPF